MAWQIRGQYMETCNCDFLCPCPLTGLAESTHGTCTFAMAFRIDDGSFNGTSLDGLNFVIVGRTPGQMAEGNWEVGLLTDERADQEQQEALLQIASGQAGGPVANLAPLIGNFLGVEPRPIQFAGEGSTWSVDVPDTLSQAVQGAEGLGGENLHLDNSGHPAADRLALARAQYSRFNAFGIHFENEAGGNNGHFAPFDWSG
ncbi:MAG TPA: DUF1326 domain-containing protein [Longimicrobiales bacterium]|nr:DUF1326 domain-containing protein [Longimicrobiales bacterium]